MNTLHQAEQFGLLGIQQRDPDAVEPFERRWRRGDAKIYCIMISLFLLTRKAPTVQNKHLLETLRCPSQFGFYKIIVSGEFCKPRPLPSGPHYNQGMSEPSPRWQSIWVFWPLKQKMAFIMWEGEGGVCNSPHVSEDLCHHPKLLWLHDTTPITMIIELLHGRGQQLVLYTALTHLQRPNNACDALCGL